MNVLMRCCLKSRSSRLFQPPKRPRKPGEPTGTPKSLAIPAPASCGTKPPPQAGADRPAEAVGAPRVGELRHEAAAEVGIERAPVVLVVEAELGAAQGVAGVEH